MRLTRAEVEAYRALRTKEGRTGAGRFLLEGWRSLSAAVAAGAPIVSVAVRTDDIERPELAALQNVPIRTISERDLQRVSATEHSQGVMAQVAIAPHGLKELWEPGERLVLALDGVADPGNVGTIIRTADWFGAAGIVLGEGCADVFNGKVVRATAGSLFHLPIVGDVRLPDAMRDARSARFSIVVADVKGAIPLDEWRAPKRCVVVFGSEAHGVSAMVAEIADLAVAIPRRGRAESLNVAVAAGILLQHASRSAGFAKPHPAANG